MKLVLILTTFSSPHFQPDVRIRNLPCLIKILSHKLLITTQLKTYLLGDGVRIYDRNISFSLFIWIGVIYFVREPCGVTKLRKWVIYILMTYDMYAERRVRIIIPSTRLCGICNRLSQDWTVIDFGCSIGNTYSFSSVYLSPISS